MMNRSTQKELIKLMLQLNEMWPQLDLSNSEQQNMVLDILNTISAKCQKDFSKTNADWYVDTMESLGQVIKMTDWQNMGREELAQCVRLCQDIILQVINNLRNEKELKKDIVFLPYQASMWDSLESVWKAANEDKEHCNTYVIPIPYASLTPEHTAAEWHCERGLFPEYVPTLDWQTVDLEEMHPDVIFIHNPYDECNWVTSVERRYYSSNLKHCTDKLVYIPYSVEEEIQPGNEVEENAIEHRILLPAFFNSDLIIAQSEDMRQVWINILTRRTNMNNRAYWEKRILSLGSPKIDKVLTSKKEDFEMLEKWRKLIGNKKVILYITSIAPTLQNSDKVCAKLRYVFDTFRNRDDVVLWWRPHPLMKATFHSMRPQYEEEYISIEKKYIDEGWGIYDDSADLHRAICWSDAYYGDSSSVLTLYKRTGKPIMMQELNSSLLNYGIYFFLNMEYDKKRNFVWIHPLETNVIMSIDYSSGIAIWDGNCFCNEFMADHDYGLHNHAAVRMLKEKIYLCPYWGDTLWEYNIQKKLCKRISLGLENDARIFVCINWNEKIFCFGQRRMVIEYDTFNGCIEYHTKGFSNLSVYINDAFAYVDAYCIYDNRAYMTVAKNNCILIFDFESRTIKEEYVGSNQNQYYHIDTDGKYIWLLTKQMRVVRWNPVKNEICERQIIVLNNTSRYPYGIRIICVKNNVIVLPYFDYPYIKNMYILDSELKQVKVKSINQYTERGYVCATVINNMSIIAYEAEKNELHEFDSQGNLIRVVKIEHDEKLKSIWKNKMPIKKVMYEPFHQGIAGLINRISQNPVQGTSEAGCGEVIYKKLIN